MPENLWNNCPACANMIHHKDLNENLRVCLTCNYHFRMTAEKRIEVLFGKENFKEIELEKTSDDPLGFNDKKKYKDRLKEYRKKTNRQDAFILGSALIDGKNAIYGFMNFNFMGGSMGSVVGEKFVRAVNLSIDTKIPLVCFCASGGARMQEAFLSLMQLAKTTSALVELDAAKIPYISVLTDPTTGGVSASIAMLGDINIAEPGALIGFAGPRVIEQTVRETLPEGFQRSEFLLEKGAIDMIVDRREMRQTISTLIRNLLSNQSQQ